MTVGSYQFNHVKMDARQLRTTVDRLKSERDLLEKQREALEGVVRESERVMDLYTKVQELLRHTSEFTRNVVKHKIENLVTQALKVVFDKDYMFRIELTERSKRVECDFYLDDGQVETRLRKPDYDRGGGVIDVVSIALLLSVGELTGNKGTLFLDEVGKHISAEYAANVAYFLKEYSATFGRQIVLITHNPQLAEAADVSLHVRQYHGNSEVAAT